MIVATKCFVLGFCYEILKKIRKHKISHKTHSWHYVYWASQVLMLFTIAAAISFDIKNQKNPSALKFLYISCGIDLSLLVGMFVWFCISACIVHVITCMSSGKSKERNEEEMTILPAGEFYLYLPKTTTINCLNKTYELSSHKIMYLSRDTEINLLERRCFNFSKDQVIQLEKKQIQIPAETTFRIPENGYIQISQKTTISLPVETKITPSLELVLNLPVDEINFSVETAITLRRGAVIKLSKVMPLEVPRNTKIFFSAELIIHFPEDVENVINLPAETKIIPPGITPINLSAQHAITLPKKTKLTIALSSETMIIPVKGLKSIVDECVPPPLTTICQFNCCNTTCSKYIRKCCNTFWIIGMNIVSLITFLAFIGYLSQAFPAIVISYYLNPTASLIRLGFFEVIIVVMLLEVSYLLFLLDKCTWLCYFHKYKKYPKEIEVDDDLDSGKNLQLSLNQYIYDDELITCKELCGCRCCRKCHWLICTVLFQIITMFFIIGLSGLLLYFLLNIVIQQTSNPNNQFKDVLAIVPTIALNLWLLFRQIDFGRALKDIAQRANEQHHHIHSHNHAHIMHSASHHSLQDMSSVV